MVAIPKIRKVKSFPLETGVTQRESRHSSVSGYEPPTKSMNIKANISYWRWSYFTNSIILGLGSDFLNVRCSVFKLFSRWFENGTLWWRSKAIVCLAEIHVEPTRTKKPRRMKLSLQRDIIESLCFPKSGELDESLSRL